MSTNRLPLYTLWLTYFLSHVGNILASLAIPWFVLQTTGSAAQTGVTAFFGIVPTVIGMLFGGTIVDRIDKSASVIADVASGVFLALIPLLYMTVGLPFPALLFLVFMGALLDAPGGSARVSMMPELAEAAGLSLDRTNAIDGIIQRATVMLGAPLAGILIAMMGAINLLWLDAATFFFSAIAIWVVIPSGLVEVEKEEAPAEKPSSLVSEFVEGVRFVRKDALILMIIVTIMVMNAVDGAVFSVVLPVQMNDLHGNERGAAYLGWLIGVWGAGAVIGGIVYSRVAERLPRRVVFLVSLGLAPVYLVFLWISPTIWMLMVAFGIGGLVIAPLNPILRSVMFERVPKTMRARVLGLTSAGVQVFMPLGVLASGFLVERFTVQTTLLIFIAMYFVTVASFLINPSNKLIERAEVQPV